MFDKLKKFIKEFESCFKRVECEPSLPVEQIVFGITSRENGDKNIETLNKYKYDHKLIRTAIYEHASCAETSLISEMYNYLIKLKRRRKVNRPENLILFWRKMPCIDKKEDFNSNHPIYRGITRFSCGREINVR